MMFINIKYASILFGLFIFSLPVLSQEKEMREAYKDFNDLQFHTAVAKYLQALDKLKEEEYQQRNYATYMIAECYRMMNDYEQAELHYKDLLETEFASANPIINLRWAEILQSANEPEKAMDYYKKYLKDDPRSQVAKLGVQSCQWMMANAHRRARVNISVAAGINSPADDFAPAPVGRDFDKLVFTSNRTGALGKKTDEWWGTPFSDLFASTLHGESWSDPELLDRSEVINTDLHEGTACFSQDYKRMYFTRCERWDEKKRYCSILVSSLSDTAWSEPEILFSDTSSNFGQPTVSDDELTIIFSSSVKGGEGGKDL